MSLDMHPIPTDFDIKKTRQIIQITIGESSYEFAYDYDTYSTIAFEVVCNTMCVFEDENINVFRALALLGHNIKNYTARDIFIDDKDGQYEDYELCDNNYDIVLYTPLHSLPLSQIHFESVSPTGN